ncbi:alpha/beta hydrolase [Mangrovimonas sp. ST2L15]|uniref:alpha/beta hydrolase n=1 Tax=Mangrovimonas sp. ST2L15 TaxID=1645916 RepID=UPI0006B44000|nr:alpha/beta hydrolase-fold protein [Mangrovimonas sp. ST2L15]
MKRFICLTFVLLLFQSLTAQVIYEPFNSAKLGRNCEIKIQLPRGYDSEEKIEYPLIVVLDGDYLFEPVIGNVDYQSYWDDMPGCIVVGINQDQTRTDDFSVTEENYFPSMDGAKFFEFVGQELVPYINDTYHASDFRIIVGHDLSANFLNFYLFKELPLFRAYVSLSPDLSPMMVERLGEKMPAVQTDTFYYLATGEEDASALKEGIEACNAVLSAVENPKFHYRFDNFEATNHYSLVGLALPKAISQIFNLYKPITKKEYQEDILTYEGSPYDYLVKKYESIESFYGFKKKLIENDIRAIAAASNKKDDIESLENLAKWAKKEYPDSMISSYYMGMWHEKAGDLKRALHSYQSGLLLQSSQFIDKDMLLEKMYEIKGEN